MNAPIIVTVYNRLDHFKKCIKSLLNNELAINSVLYISSDAAYRTNDVAIIEEIRQFSKRIIGFKDVVCLFQETNQGLLKCYYNSIQLILEKYDRFIFLEDDIVVSPDFLNYMNDALEFYEDNKRVFSISSFSLSLFNPDKYKDVKSEVYFTHRFNPWGFGMWKDRYLTGNEYNINDIRESLNNYGFRKLLNQIGTDLYPAFLGQIALKKTLALDYLNVYHMVKNDLFTLSPYSSKSFNFGNDGGGTRTNQSLKYTNANTSFLNKKTPYILIKEIQNSINDTLNGQSHNFRNNKIKIILFKLGLLSLGYKLKRLKKVILNLR